MVITSLLTWLMNNIFVIVSIFKYIYAYIFIFSISGRNKNRFLLDYFMRRVMTGQKQLSNTLCRYQVEKITQDTDIKIDSQICTY